MIVKDSTISFRYQGGSKGRDPRIVEVKEVTDEHVLGTDMVYGGIKQFLRHRIDGEPTTVATPKQKVVGRLTLNVSPKVQIEACKAANPDMSNFRLTESGWFVCDRKLRHASFTFRDDGKNAVLIVKNVDDEELEMTSINGWGLAFDETAINQLVNHLI